MPRRIIDVDGERWEVAVSGRSTQYTKDEFGLVFTRGTGPDRERRAVRVVSGCEFSPSAPWGEMHVLGYFLPTDSAPLEAFLERCRADRMRRARAMVDRLRSMGVALDFEDVLRQAPGGAGGGAH